MAGRVICESDEGISWNIPPMVSELKAGEAHIWRVQHSTHKETLDYYSSLLNAEEQAKSARYFKEADRHRYINTRAALRIILSKYINIPAGKIQFTLGKNKKPELTGHSNQIHFNVSHSGSYSLIAIAKFELGVDIEFINNQLNYGDLVNCYFSKEEAVFIQSSTEPAKAFYTCWTRKEALLKGLSTGLNSDLQSVPCLDGTHVINATITDENWNVKTFNADPNHICSAAFNTVINEVKYYKFDPTL